MSSFLLCKIPLHLFRCNILDCKEVFTSLCAWNWCHYFSLTTLAWHLGCWYVLYFEDVFACPYPLSWCQLFSKTNIASVVTICYSAKHVCLVMYLELMFNISLQVLSVASLFLWYAVLQTVVDSSISVAFWVVTWTSRICCSDLLHSYEAFAWPYSVCCCRHFSSAAVAWYIYCCDMLPY